LSASPKPTGAVSRKVVLSVLLTIYVLIVLAAVVPLLRGRDLIPIAIIFGVAAFLGAVLSGYALVAPPKPKAKRGQPPSYFYASFQGGNMPSWRLVDRDAIAASPLVLILAVTCCCLPVAAFLNGKG
jgi:hypothetical protein